MSQLLIIGASGHGKVVADTAEAVGKWSQLTFLDDDYANLNGTLRWPVVGGSRDFPGMAGTCDSAVVAIGHAQTRLGFIDALTSSCFVLPVLCHPFTAVSSSAVIGEGTVIFAGAVIQADARLGRGVIVNTQAGVDHDCVLGDGVHVCPGAHLAGNVIVGDGSWLGIGCAIKQGARVGRGVTVGAGAVVVNDVDDGLTVVGCPARPVRATESK